MLLETNELQSFWQFCGKTAFGIGQSIIFPHFAGLSHFLLKIPGCRLGQGGLLRPFPPQNRT
jgi:hypothetical protein